MSAIDGETPVAVRADIVRNGTQVVVIFYPRSGPAIAAVMDHSEATRFSGRVRKAANDAAAAAARDRG